jgi:hypothetical protein
MRRYAKEREYEEKGEQGGAVLFKGSVADAAED